MKHNKMEAVLYSDTNVEKTVDVIESMLSLGCNNIWCWLSKELYNGLKDEVWESEVHLYSNDQVSSIGDCLREMYVKDESRSDLVVIGDLENLPDKYSLHKNGFGKNMGTIMFADGNVGYSTKKGKLLTYGADSKQKGYALDIAYCRPLILSVFYDQFDCDHFHDLLLTDTVKNNYGIKMDKRIKHFIEADVTVSEDSETFLSELEEMLEINVENAKLELNSLRMSYGLLVSDLIKALNDFGARQELIDLFQKN